MVIIVEGVPGSGKTTTIEHLINKLKSDKLLVVPEILSETKGDLNDSNFYIRNDRNKSNVLKNNLNKVYLSDRYWHSTVVYKCAEDGSTTLGQLVDKYKMLYDGNMFNDYFYIYLETDIYKSLDKAATHDIESGWKNMQFVKKTLNLYQHLYDHLEEIVPKIQGKLLLNVNNLGYAKVESIIEGVILNNE